MASGVRLDMNRGLVVGEYEAGSYSLELFDICLKTRHVQVTSIGANE
jgi:hypothetical protein